MSQGWPGSKRNGRGQIPLLFFPLSPLFSPFYLLFNGFTLLESWTEAEIGRSYRQEDSRGEGRSSHLGQCAHGGTLSLVTTPLQGSSAPSPPSPTRPSTSSISCGMKLDTTRDKIGSATTCGRR